MKKKLVLAILILSLSLLFGQDYYERSAVLAEPSISYDLNRPIETTTITSPELAPEMEFSSGRQSVKIPFAYPLGNFVVSANLPLQRITATSGDKSKSAIGIGDISVGGAYRSYLPEGFNGWNMDYSADISVKLPTGDKDKTVEISNVDYGTPMGSGSLDFTAAGNVILSTDNREILADVKYRLNGEDEDEVKNGNMLSMKGRYGFLKFEPKFDGYLGFLVVVSGDAKAGSSDVESSMFLMDFVPELHYLTGMGMFKVGFSMPLITSAESKFTREYTVRFGFSKSY
ncbi:MAG: transporter [Candidatus Cloacimonetes bacterium]|nr:transporter [Candidatus Cloacimonadota bacterium]MCF7813582.1 transporter [Candidatus Cloacimonadota bacterium]MCF7868213.1 transporter [Candidatus Cloacimonadota bacterium]MCF7883623.1 transporter [Candidatus Cloacimonadota bacterium]